MYQQADLVVICWMCVFTKNLYNKIVIVFTEENFHYLRCTLLIWIPNFFIGVLCQVITEYCGFYYYGIFDIVCSCAVLCVLCYNAWLFINVYVVVIKRNTSEGRIKDIIKSCVIAFIIVTISFLQVLTINLLKYLCSTNIIIQKISAIVNAFQAIAMSIIFMILVKNV